MKQKSFFAAFSIPTISPEKKKKIFRATYLFVVLLLFYLTCIHYQEPHEFGIGWNRMSGEVIPYTRAAWHLSWPWVSVSVIDIRPARVCITSASRAVNCKLVHFEPRAYKEFVATEGFRYYWFSNRVSFNWGYAEEYHGMRDILRGYAFSAYKYPFITITQEYQ